MSGRRDFLRGLGAGTLWLSWAARAEDPPVDEAALPASPAVDEAALPASPAVDSAGLAPASAEGEAAPERVADAGAPEPMVDEAEPAAATVEYVADAARVDPARHPTFRADQNCASCAVYTGATGEPSGGCVLFPHKRVAAQGWCTAWSGDS